MSFSFIDGYVIQFLVRGQLQIVEVIPNDFGDIMENAFPGSQLMKGITPDRKEVFIPMGAIKNVFAQKLKVWANFDGRGVERTVLDENEIAPHAEKVRRVETLDGEKLFQRWENFDQIKQERAEVNAAKKSHE